MLPMKMPGRRVPAGGGDPAPGQSFYGPVVGGFQRGPALGGPAGGGMANPYKAMSYEDQQGLWQDWYQSGKWMGAVPGGRNAVMAKSAAGAGRNDWSPAHKTFGGYMDIVPDVARQNFQDYAQKQLGFGKYANRPPGRGGGAEGGGMRGGGMRGGMRGGNFSGPVVGGTSRQLRMAQMLRGGGGRGRGR